MITKQDKLLQDLHPSSWQVIKLMVAHLRTPTQVRKSWT